MPLSFLVHTSRLTVASVIRPCARNASNSTACSHGFSGMKPEVYKGRGVLGREMSTGTGAFGSKHLKRRGQGQVDMKLLARFFISRGLVVGMAAAVVGGVKPVLGCGGANGNGNATGNGMQKRNHSGCGGGMFAPEIEELFHGNEQYVHSMNQMNPGLLANLAINGQQPPFMMVDCSDSRVSEQDIFSAKPGTMFTAGNIANRFDEDDPNSNAILSFAVETLKVKHVIVMGHYGCGGVAASMMKVDPFATRPADLAVQAWIEPIRKVYERSDRPEIVAHRLEHLLNPLTELPGLHDPAFRALVEENVKANVLKIAKSSVITDHYTAVAKINGNAANTNTNTTSNNSTDASNNTPRGYGDKPVTEIYIHGWVYDVESGKVADLGVSVGPPGKDVPVSPFPGVGK